MVEQLVVLEVGHQLVVLVNASPLPQLTEMVQVVQVVEVVAVHSTLVTDLVLQGLQNHLVTVQEQP